jgi:alpha-beta hydrolase superfamily lysophospholipase
MAKVLFLHGWNSKIGGVKPTYLAEHGHTVINPALPDDNFAESVRIAQAEVDRHQPDVIVGSSRGGAVAMNVDPHGASLVLLCPAWKKWGTATTVQLGSLILHSEADDVVPIAHSRDLVTSSGLPEWALIVVGNDHRLADPVSLATLLASIEGRNWASATPGQTPLR